MTYGTNTALTAYLALTGRTLTGDADQARAAGSAYINGTYWNDLKGSAVSYDAAFPRTGISGVEGDEVPTNVENATYEAAYQWGLDVTSLTATTTASGTVKREKVEGAVEVEYFEGGTSNSDGVPRFSSIEGLMHPFLRSRFGNIGMGLHVV